jgi:hypothetical protein
VERDFRDQEAAPPWWRFGFDGKALVEIGFGSVVGLIALFSSYDHISFPHRQFPIQQQWGVWLIVVSLPLVLVVAAGFCEAVAQLAAGSRRRAEVDRARDAARVARLDRIRNRLDRSRLAFELDPSADHRRQLERLLILLGSPQVAALLGRTSLQP